MCIPAGPRLGQEPVAMSATPVSSILSDILRIHVFVLPSRTCQCSITRGICHPCLHSAAHRRFLYKAVRSPNDLCVRVCCDRIWNDLFSTLAVARSGALSQSPALICGQSDQAVQSRCPSRTSESAYACLLSVRHFNCTSAMSASYPSSSWVTIDQPQDRHTAACDIKSGQHSASVLISQ